MRAPARGRKNPQLFRKLRWFAVGVVPIAITGCGGQSHGDQGAGGNSGAGMAATGGSTTGAGGSSAGVGQSGSGGGGGAVLGGSGGAGGELGGSAGSSGSAGQSLPVDDRPPAPAWNPKLPLGTPGWQTSQQPLCDTHQGSPLHYGVWADSRGVYAAVAEDCGVNAASGGVECGKQGLGLQFNDGTGWQLLLADPAASGAQVRGFPGGPAILLAYGPPDSRSDSVTFVTGSMISVQPRLGLDQGASAEGVFGVDADHAVGFALHVADTASTTVREYSAGAWSTLATVPIANPHAIWADHNDVVLAGSDQSIYVKSGSAAFAPLAGAPAGDYWSVWGLSAQDLWFGNSVGQLVHFDGASWQVIPTSAGGPIYTLWGAEGQVYFSTGDTFGRWNGTASETLIDATSGLTIADVWGRSSTEVFLALNDPSFAGYRCGQYFAVWFDGTKFHQF